jgi:pimeloyl-ACP methyl ester carboxylesterase
MLAWTIFRWTASLLAAAVFVAVLFGLRWIPAALLARDIADGCDSCKGFAREPVSWTVDGRVRQGDAYDMEGSKRGGLVLVPGASPQGRDDPRFIAFARAFARAGFIVLAPEIENLRTMRLSASDITAIGDAVERLAPITGPVGILSLSYASAPALLATLEPRLAGKVKFLVAIGGYHDAMSTIRWFTTGAHRAGPESPWEFGTPNAYGRWVFVRNNAELLGDARDRATLEAMAVRKFESLDAPIDDLVAQLGPEGRRVQALLDNHDPAAVPGLIADLPPAIHDAIAALDPSRAALGRFPAKVILVHGRDDAIIPWSESAALARALPPGKAELFTIDQLAHVDLKLDRVGDVLSFLRAVEAILRASR